MTTRMIPVTNGRRAIARRVGGLPTFGWGLLGSEWDQWLNHLIEEPWTAFTEGGPALSISAPALKLSERDDEYVVRADVPGVAPEDLKVEVEGGRLTVCGEVRHESETRIDGGVRKEKAVDTFQRSVTLPGPVNPDEVVAECADGVLTVTLPRRIDDAPKKKVEVRRKKQ